VQVQNKEISKKVSWGKMDGGLGGSMQLKKRKGLWQVYFSIPGDVAAGVTR